MVADHQHDVGLVRQEDGPDARDGHEDCGCQGCLVEPNGNYGKLIEEAIIEVAEGNNGSPGNPVGNRQGKEVGAKALDCGKAGEEIGVENGHVCGPFFASLGGVELHSHLGKLTDGLVIGEGVEVVSDAHLVAPLLVDVVDKGILSKIWLVGNLGGGLACRRPGRRCQLPGFGVVWKLRHDVKQLSLSWRVLFLFFLFVCGV